MFLALGLASTAFAIGIMAFTFMWRRGPPELDDDDEDVKPRPKKTVRKKVPAGKSAQKKQVKSPKTEGDSQAKESPKQDQLPSDPAVRLKEEGNAAFKAGDYATAVKCYTAALQQTDKDTHFLFSNRSAAFLQMKQFVEALEDAEACIKLKPDWCKGYFRKGKVLMAEKKYNEAYSQFYTGLLKDPKNDELLKQLETAKQELSFGDLDSRAILDREVLKYFMVKTSQSLCESIHVNYDDIVKIVSKPDVTREEIESNDQIKQLLNDHPVEILRVVTEILLNLEKNDLANQFAEEASQKAPDDASVLQILTHTVLKKSDVDATGSKAVQNLSKALQLNPQDVLIIHTYATLMMRLFSFAPVAPQGKTIQSVLEELRMGLDNPNANHLLIADCGIRIWFKLFEDHSIMRELQNEEERNAQMGLKPEDAYLNGLIGGVFSKLCLIPFFMQSLCQVVFNNPGLERVLYPFRTAFLSLDSPDSRFTKIEPLIYAMALQCIKNNYSWAVGDEEMDKVSAIVVDVKEMISERKPEELVVDGILEPQLQFSLALISLYQNLATIDGLYDIATRVDLGKCHKWFARILKKTVLAAHEEEELKSQIQLLTTPPSSKIQQFYDTLQPSWDSAGVNAGRLSKITIKQELQWLFPDHQFDLPDTGTQALVAGCVSGNELFQLASVYEGAEFVGVDCSASNLAYGIRQCKELGLTTAKFYLADIDKLEPSHFPKLFDVIFASTLISRVPEPLETWERLAALVRPGGIMKLSFFTKNFIDLLTSARRHLRSSTSFGKSHFSNSRHLPDVLKIPTVEEARLSRHKLIDADESSTFQELLMIPSFYSLNEFTDLVFHPHTIGFSFLNIQECVQKLGLEIVGFEFPGLAQETILKYRVEFPQDPNMKDPNSLHIYDTKNPEAFKNYTHTINLVCEKPK